MTDIFKEWNARVEGPDNQEFYSLYLEQEAAAYAKILSGGEREIKGTVAQLCEDLGMDHVVMGGFLEGINTSLEEPLSLEELTEESAVSLGIDFEKLYHNMLKAKADWLFTLPEWDNVLDREKRTAIRKVYNTENIARSEKIGRNEPCPCGSGKKYKKCCGA
ncbi:MAG: SEC-C metal-binding domain-containing protein [Clostridia bacterium]